MIRFKEYVSAGAVAMDTIVTYDSLKYSIKLVGGTIIQKDMLSDNTYTSYIVKDEMLLVKNNFISGYSEKLSYTYNSKDQLIMVVYDLKSDNGSKAKNVLKMFYTDNDLLLRTEFYDETNSLIEEKMISYK